ncbi:MAG TPA: response regulator [Bacteroidales bacterium]|nr:response regulator [Bacteroidales bacterium]
MTETGIKSGTILVIEDEPAHAELLKIYLSESGRWLVHVATSIDEFNELVRSADPDIIVADINLPDGSSLSLLEENHNKPWIIMTSYADPETESEIINSGASGFFVKSPDTFRNISSIVEDYLQKWRTEH